MLHTDRGPRGISDLFCCLLFPNVVVDEVVPHCLTKTTANPRFRGSLNQVGVDALMPHPAKTAARIAPDPGALEINAGPLRLLAGAWHWRACKYSFRDSLDG